MTEFELLLQIATLAQTDSNGSYEDPNASLAAIANLLQRNQIGVNHR